MVRLPDARGDVPRGRISPPFIGNSAKHRSRDVLGDYFPLS